MNRNTSKFDISKAKRNSDSRYHDNMKFKGLKSFSFENSEISFFLATDPGRPKGPESAKIDLALNVTWQIIYCIILVGLF